MPQFVMDYQELNERIDHWRQGFIASHPVPVEAANHTKHWYYSLAYNAFAPSKFIGYADVSFESYDPDELDGGQTEQAIRRLGDFQELQGDYPLADAVRAHLGAFLGRRDRKARADAVIHVPILNPIRRLMLGMTFSQDLYSYKPVFLRALLLHHDDPSVSTHEYFWRFYRDRRSAGIPVEREGSAVLDLNLDVFSRSAVGAILDAPYDSINKAAGDAQVITRSNGDYALTEAILAKLPANRDELDRYLEVRIEDYYEAIANANRQESTLRSIFQTFATQFAANTQQQMGGDLPFKDTLCLRGKERVEEYLASGPVDSSQLVVRGSVGQGNISNYPWLAVFDTRVTRSARLGYYIVYLFSDDMSEVYLTLNQASTVGGRELQDQTRAKVRSALGEIPGFTFGALPPGSLVINPQGNSGLGRAYERTNIYYKRYAVNSRLKVASRFRAIGSHFRLPFRLCSCPLV